MSTYRGLRAMMIHTKNPFQHPSVPTMSRLALCLRLLLCLHTSWAWTMKKPLLKTMDLPMTPDPNHQESSSNRSEEPSSQQLLELLRPSPTCTPSQMSGTHLAYIGDCVYELFIRSKLVWPSKKTSDMQQQAVSMVNAEYQSMLLKKLKESYDLTLEEQTVLSRGRNATTRSVNRRNPAAYQDSTALEALLGYLFIKDEARLCDLLGWLDENIEWK